MKGRIAECLAASVLALSALLSLPSTAQETQADEAIMYVTDELLLGLYSGKGGTGDRLRMLKSNTRLQLLSRDGQYAEVLTPQGDKGWVKSAFLVAEKPARVRLGELEAKNRTVVEELTALREREQQSNGWDPETVARLESELAKQKGALAEAQKTIAEQNRELGRFNEELDSKKRHAWLEPVKWAAISALISMVVGVVFGYGWFDRRLRRRFYGLRIG